MGMVSLGRSLIIRQLLLAGLLMALGFFAYSLQSEISRLAETGSDPAAILASAQHGQFLLLLATAAGCLVMLAVSVPATYYTVSKPIRAIADTVERLAAGDFAIEIAGETRNDEIGTIARGLGVLREAARAAPGKALNENSRVREISTRALAAKVETFAEDLAASVRRLAAMTQRMTEASKVMIVAAENANEGSDLAKTASANAAGDVSSVATPRNSFWFRSRRSADRSCNPPRRSRIPSSGRSRQTPE